MNNDQIDDLKQFISTTISQQTSDLREDLQGVHQDLENMDAKIDGLSAAVAGSLESTHEAFEAQLRAHDTRITRLEQKTA